MQQKIKQSPNRGSALCGQNQAPPWLNLCRSSLGLKSWVGIRNFLWYSSCSIIGISKLLSVNPSVLLFYFLDAASDWMFLPLSPISVAGAGHYQGSTAQVHRLLIATSAGTAVCGSVANGKACPLPLTRQRTAKHKWHRRTLPPSLPFFLLLAPSSTRPATPHVPFHSRTTYWHTQLKQVQPFTWKYISHSVSLQLPSTVTVEDWGPSSKWPTFLVPQQCVDSIPDYFPIKLVVKHAPAGSSQADWISVSNAFEN